MNRKNNGIAIVILLCLAAFQLIMFILYAKSTSEQQEEINIPLFAMGREYEDSPHLFAIVKSAYDRYLTEHRELPDDFSFLPEYIQKRIEKGDSALWYGEESGILYYNRAVEPIFLYELVILKRPLCDSATAVTATCPMAGEQRGNDSRGDNENFLNQDEIVSEAADISEHPGTTRGSFQKHTPTTK